MNYDGPAQTLADEFSALTSWTVKASDELGKATPGSLGEWAGRDHGIAVITIEWKNGTDSRSDWERVKPGVLAIISGTPRLPTTAAPRVP